MDKRKIIYYRNELEDEFSKAQITPKKIDESYVYVHDSLFKLLTHFFWYRVVAIPLAFGYMKLFFGHKVINGKLLKKSGGCFVFGNHTQDIGDACIPSLLCPSTDSYIIVHPNNVSIPFIGKITPSLGALPLPDDMAAYRNFLWAVEKRVGEGKRIVIYPEAHIWPYFTGIRQFSDSSFFYPVKYNVPVFCFTNTYRKRRFRKRPRIVTYVDGPFYPDETLPERKRKKQLRDAVYDKMCERAKTSDAELIKYVKVDEENDG